MTLNPLPAQESELDDLDEILHQIMFGVTSDTNHSTNLTFAQAKQALTAYIERQQHLHLFDDTTYKCAYCGLGVKQLSEQTSKLAQLKSKEK